MTFRSCWKGAPDRSFSREPQAAAVEAETAVARLRRPKRSAMASRKVKSVVFARPRVKLPGNAAIRGPANGPVFLSSASAEVRLTFDFRLPVHIQAEYV